MILFLSVIFKLVGFQSASFCDVCDSSSSREAGEVYQFASKFSVPIPHLKKERVGDFIFPHQISRVHLVESADLVPMVCKLASAVLGKMG